jgi:hypothetical protein
MVCTVFFNLITKVECRKKKLAKMFLHSLNMRRSVVLTPAFHNNRAKITNPIENQRSISKPVEALSQVCRKQYRPTSPLKNLLPGSPWSDPKAGYLAGRKCVEQVWPM